MSEVYITVSIHDVRERPPPSVFSRSSTHSFGVAEAGELARALGQLPERVLVFGIEGARFLNWEGTVLGCRCGGRRGRVRRITDEVRGRLRSGAD